MERVNSVYTFSRVAPDFKCDMSRRQMEITSLKLKRKIWAKDTDLGVISAKKVVKSMGQMQSQGEGESEQARRELRTEPLWDTRM